jgi:hypothetical protein
VSSIDAPLLKSMSITFFNQLLFVTPQLRHFISRTGIFSAPDCAHIVFYNNSVFVCPGPFGTLILCILCKPSEWQLSSLSQLYNSALSSLPALEDLRPSENRH